MQGYTTSEQELEKIKPSTSSSFGKIKLHPTEEKKPKDIDSSNKKTKENERPVQPEDQTFKQTAK